MPPGKRAFSSDPALTMETNDQIQAGDIPAASDVPAAALLLAFGGCRHIGSGRNVVRKNLIVGFGHGESRDQN